MIIRFTKQAEKDLARMDKPVAKELVDFLENSISVLADPRSDGRALSGEWRGYWRYRLGKYRIICKIVDEEITIIVIKIGPCDSVYK